MKIEKSDLVILVLSISLASIMGCSIEQKQTPKSEIQSTSEEDDSDSDALNFATPDSSTPKDRINDDSTPAIPEFASLEEGFHESPNLPFIIRGAKELSEMSLEKGLSRLKASKQTVFGYDKKGKYVEDLRVSRLVKDWERDKLNVKVLDSPIHVFDLPAALRKHHSFNKVTDKNKEKLGQTVILSRSDSYTPLHMDPPAYGGGWMYLWQGQKDWHLLSPKWMRFLLNNTKKKLLDILPQDLQTYLFERFPGKKFRHAQFYFVRANAGDFVYFPPGWMHRVWTQDKAIGLGGYIRPTATIKQARKVEEELTSYGLNAIWK